MFSASSFNSKNLHDARQKFKSKYQNYSSFTRFYRPDGPNKFFSQTPKLQRRFSLSLNTNLPTTELDNSHELDNDHDMNSTRFTLCKFIYLFILILYQSCLFFFCQIGLFVCLIFSFRWKRWIGFEYNRFEKCQLW